MTDNDRQGGRQKFLGKDQPRIEEIDGKSGVLRCRVSKDLGTSPWLLNKCHTRG